MKLLLALVLISSFCSNLFAELNFKDDKVDTLFIVAARFDFQKEVFKKTITSGDGTFEYETISQYNIDPTPHNREYFETHFLGANNYFNSVSKGKFVVKYKVFPELSQKSYHLPFEMSVYSPATNDPKEKADSLMNIVRDVLKATNSTELSDVTTFYKKTKLRESDNFKVVFSVIHAGAFLGTDGITPAGGADSPSDIISTYISPKDFKDYSSILVSNNSLGLDRMIMIPERATQDSIEFQGESRVEFSIAALLEYQIYKSLDLPDLFDVKNGEIEVGIFSPLDYANYIDAKTCGTFLGNPAAYEKTVLGWANVVSVNPLKNKSVTVKKDDVLEVHLNDNERVLFEIRGRTSETTSIHSVNENFTINDSTLLKNNKYNYGVKGTIVSADNYDFLLPSYGVLAWYVNDKKIRDGYEDNSVNVSEFGQYGVKLIEADGSYDIGDKVTTYSGSYLLRGEKSDIFNTGDSSFLEHFSKKEKLESIFKIVSITDSTYTISFSSFLTSKFLDTLSTQINLEEINFDTVTVNGKEITLDVSCKSYSLITRDDVKDILVAKVLNSGELVLENISGVKVPVNRRITGVEKVVSLVDSNGKYYVVAFSDSSYTILNSNFDEVKYREPYYTIVRDREIFPKNISSLENIYFSNNSIIDIKDSVEHTISKIIPGVTFVGLNGVYIINASIIESKEIAKLFIYPNPVTRSKTLNPTVLFNSKFNSVNGGVVKIYSLNGKLVDTIDNVSVKYGWNSVTLPIGNLYNDVYVAVLSVDGVTKQFKFAIRD